jgi:hypothetical protein
MTQQCQNYAEEFILSYPTTVFESPQPLHFQTSSHNTWQCSAEALSHLPNASFDSGQFFIQIILRLILCKKTKQTDWRILYLIQAVKNPERSQPVAHIPREAYDV